LGYYLVGKSLDTLGRRKTGVIFFPWHGIV
jgi:hypothetical protein